MTNRQRAERKLGNAIRASRGLFTVEGSTLKAVKQNPTTLAARNRIVRAAARLGLAEKS